MLSIPCGTMIALTITIVKISFYIQTFSKKIQMIGIKKSLCKYGKVDLDPSL
jgi:hypothetical protein